MLNTSTHHNIVVSRWSADTATLLSLGDGRSWADTPTRRAVKQGTALRKKLGHYLGATFYYGGEWYWGVDRLHYLEERLTTLGLRRAGSVPGLPIVAPPEELATAGSAEDLRLQAFVSLRSPYSAIAMDRIYEMADRTGIALEVKPVLPMVMRGLPIPTSKRMYIVRDTKREADRLRIAFGRIADPVGEPVERAFSIYPWACAEGRERDYLLSFFGSVWSKGVDAGSNAGMRRIVEGAGLDWKHARTLIDNDDWRDAIEGNRTSMFEAGLWGVPSFVLSQADGSEPFATWGQDRLWLLEAEIRRRAL